MRGVPRGVAAALFIVVAELSRAHVVARPVVARVVHRVRECGAVRSRAGQDVMLVRHVAYAIDTLFLFTECDLLAESVSRPRLIDRVAMKRPEVPGDHLAISGTNGAPGRLLFFNGNRSHKILTGTTAIKERTWNHVVLVRNGKGIRVYLNGNIEPEIAGEAEFGNRRGGDRIFVGGSSDNFVNLEGKIDEVAVYRRALGPEEVVGHFKASGALVDR